MSDREKLQAELDEIEKKLEGDKDAFDTFNLVCRRDELKKELGIMETKPVEVF